MKVLLLGGNGMMGPWVVRALEGRHQLRITDVIGPPDDSGTPFRRGAHESTSPPGEPVSEVGGRSRPIVSSPLVGEDSEPVPRETEGSEGGPAGAVLSDALSPSKGLSKEGRNSSPWPARPADFVGTPSPFDELRTPPPASPAEGRGSSETRSRGGPHEYRQLSADDLPGVIDAAEGMDAIINLSVVRQDRRAAFDVSTRGVYNTMVAARTHGIRRAINTGPRGQVASDRYADFDFDLNPDMPPQTGTRLYWITKGLGFEIARVFAERLEIYVQTLLFYQLKDPATLAGPDGAARLGQDTIPYVVAWRDAAEAIRLALEVDLATLPSRFETYFVTTDLPHGVYSNEKLKRVLGWQPAYRFEPLWSRGRSRLERPVR